MSGEAGPGEKGQSGGSGWSSVRSFACILLVVAAATWSAAGTAGAERPEKARRRSAAPSALWDKGTAGTFFDDAFSTLQGGRPEFRPRGTAPPGGPAGAAVEPAAGQAGRPKWSLLVSEGTLTDEIKDMKGVAAAATSRPTDFKAGGYDQAREAFATLALAFAVIADHDQDVRWKKDAATARDLFARIGFNCKVGTDQSLADARLGVIDLESLLDGGGPRRQSDRKDDFLWSQVADRPTLMQRLEAAEEAISRGLAAQADFEEHTGRLIHEAEIVATVGEVVRMPDFEDHDDDAYRGYCERMREAAVRLRDACAKQDYDAARTAAGELKKSCDACHGDYRG